MLFLAIQGPQIFLMMVLVVLTMSVFVPWLDVVQRRQVYVVLLPAALATMLWQGYEFQMVQPAPIGGPLDNIATLVLIYPLLAATWISTTFAVGAAMRKNVPSKNHMRSEQTGGRT